MDPKDVHGINPPPPPPPPPPPTAPPFSTGYHHPQASSVILQVQSHPPVPWSTGLFDCFDDVGNCCITFFCPCITFGQIAEIVDRGSTSCRTSGGLYALILCLSGCQWVYSCFYRSKMRGQFFLEEGPCADCPVHCCCESCALCQEYRELRNRGFNLHLGWQGNMEKMSSLTRPPAVEAGMTR